MEEEEQAIYILDADVLMQAAKTFYSFSLAPTFWDALIDWANCNIVISVDKVFQEIKEGREDDPLLEWSKEHFINYFETTQTSAVIQCYADLANWAENHATYQDKAKKEFMEDDNADAWVIAYAKSCQGIVVTHELERNRTKKIAIPNVCDAFDIPYCNVFKMLENLGFYFK